MKTFPPNSSQRKPLRYSDFRPVVVISNLNKLQGPQTGSVTLPLYLDWTPRQSFQLDQEDDCIILYQTVLREAATEQDLQSYLNKELLLLLWDKLTLPKKLQTAWTDSYPELAYRAY
ncbi:MAG: hypothetical protein FWD65_03730 [Coriobacteriia bacterium]|nr:hypothetical protein [Coriobacteriia bacterium]